MRISDWSSDVCSSDLIAGRVPGAARRGCRADDSAVAIVAAVELSARQGRHRAGDVGHDHAGGAGGRAVARWLDPRSTRVAVDLLDRKSAVSGKSVSVREDLGGRGLIKKKKTQKKN